MQGYPVKYMELLETMSIDTSAVVTHPGEHISRRKTLLEAWALNTRNIEMFGKALLVNSLPQTHEHC